MAGVFGNENSGFFCFSEVIIMEDELASNELDRGFSFKAKTYSPECPPQQYQHPVCLHSDRCEGCLYPSHGFICWHDENTCLRTEIERISKKERNRRNERNH